MPSVAKYAQYIYVYNIVLQTKNRLERICYVYRSSYQYSKPFAMKQVSMPRMV